MIAEHTTPEGYVVAVYDGGYLDYGLVVTDPAGRTLYDCPCALSAEAWGADGGCADGGCADGRPWSGAEWAARLEGAADELVDHYAEYAEYHPPTPPGLSAYSA